MEKSKKKFNVKNFICIFLIFIFLGLIVFSSIKISLYIKSANDNKDIMDEIDTFVSIPDVIPQTDPDNPEEQVDITIDFEKLKEMNKDTVGWIKVNNSNINYPVVKGTNNEYYLKHNIKKKWNEAGWIFADYENKFDGTDKNIVIYGHSMKNKTMFGTLSDVLKSSWYSNSDNLNITLIYNDIKYTFRIFSAYKIEAEDYYINTKVTDVNFEGFINSLKGRSLVNYKTDISNATQILTLSTCYDNNNVRLAVHAVKVSEEKMDEEE